VGIDQPYKLQHWLLAVPRRMREHRRFHDVGRHRDGGPAQGLDPFRDRVDQRLLLAMMLVEKQVQLVKRRTGGLPVVLLVEISQGDRVGNDQVQGPTLSARTLRVSAMRMSARSLNDCIGAARCAPPGLSLASEGTVMLALLPWGNFECHDGLLDRRRPLDRVKRGWLCPMSEWFRFVWLASRLPRMGQYPHDGAVRQSVAGGVG